MQVEIKDNNTTLILNNLEMHYLRQMLRHAENHIENMLESSMGEKYKKVIEEDQKQLLLLTSKLDENK